MINGYKSKSVLGNCVVDCKIDGTTNTAHLIFILLQMVYHVQMLVLLMVFNIRNKLLLLFY